MFHVEYLAAPALLVFGPMSTFLIAKAFLGALDIDPPTLSFTVCMYLGLLIAVSIGATVVGFIGCMGLLFKVLGAP